MSRFAGYGEHINWNELCKETGKGFLFALGGVVFDELIKSREKDLEDGVAKDLKKINETVQDNIQSSGNAIGIYAKTS
ncbi:TPA: hypothetical protein ACJIXP_004945 [Escherichia coli]